SQVFALIDVDAKAPVRTDTKARLEYTGFTGVASVALIGGALDAPPLPATQGPAVIVADHSEYQDLVETARRVATQASEFFTKTNRLIDDNAASVTASLKNAEKFSDALAANSDGLKDFAAAAKAIKKAADDLDSQLKGVAAKINRFAGSGLRQYEALAADGRKTLEQINQAIRSIESNPQQFLFGKSPQIPEYSGAR
ncbi:MAG: MlaD family protein, partial [Methylocella sp.]